MVLEISNGVTGVNVICAETLLSFLVDETQPLKVEDKYQDWP